MADLIDEGVTRFRYYVGVDFEQDERFLIAFRDRFGDRVQLKALDFQGHFHWKETLRIYDRFKQYNFELIESPVWAEDYEGMAELRRRIEVDISEPISRFAPASRLIPARAVDVSTITTTSGGTSPATRTALYPDKG